MGCCGSTEEIEITGMDGASTEKVQLAMMEAEIEEQPDTKSFLATILQARLDASGDAEVMEDCVVRLKEHNSKLKQYIAVLDAQSAHDAMKGGVIGFGCNDAQLIEALCTRTKSQLARTEAKYWELYDKDIRREVKGETGGDYGRLMYYAMGTREEYVADMIDVAVTAGLWELGCNEKLLVQLFVSVGQEQLRAGRDVWEGRTDKALIDRLDAELGSSYKHLQRLLFFLLRGERNADDAEIDEEAIAAQAETIFNETEKGFFDTFDTTEVVDILATNSQSQNAALASKFEDTYDKSLGGALKAKCGKQLHFCLTALLLPPNDFIASQLEAAMKGWGTDRATLVRLLSGLDGDKMVGVTSAYEQKYDKPLRSALKDEISGNFLRAAQAWVNVLNDPTHGAEEAASAEPSEISGDAGALAALLDAVLEENRRLSEAVNSLDVERLAQACIGWGTDDKEFIQVITTRSKRYLSQISKGYRQAYNKDLVGLINAECSGWYAYLARFIVLPPAQSDLRLLDLAMDGLGSNKDALIEFLCGRSYERRRAVKKVWEERHDASLVDRFNDELKGNFEWLAKTIMKTQRDTEAPADEEKAKEQATALHEAAEAGGEEAEKKFFEILMESSFAQCELISTIYEDTYDASLRRTIDKTFKSYFKAAIQSLFIPTNDWYASRLKAAFDGWGTCDRAVCRILGCHDKKDVVEIAAAFERKYGLPLKDAIKKECSGNYKTLLVAWISLPDLLAQPEETVQVPEQIEEGGDRSPPVEGQEGEGEGGEE